MNEKYSEKLFSYGTLQYESVQLSTFGRKLKGEPDCLTGYKLTNLEIKDPKVLAISGEAVHLMLIHTGLPEDEISGIVFDISPEELQAADKYEVADYKRIEVQLSSGLESWVYVRA